MGVAAAGVRLMLPEDDANGAASAAAASSAVALAVVRRRFDPGPTELGWRSGSAKSDRMAALSVLFAALVSAATAIGVSGEERWAGAAAPAAAVDRLAADDADDDATLLATGDAAALGMRAGCSGGGAGAGGAWAAAAAGAGATGPGPAAATGIGRSGGRRALYGPIHWKTGLL